MKHWYFLALTLVPLLATAADVIPDAPHIYVEGSGEVKVAPDQMQVSVNISAANLDVEIAKAEIDAKSNTLIDSMFALSIERADIATTAVRISPKYEYRNNTNLLIGTEASREVTITLRDLSKYPQFMAALVAAKISQSLETRFKASNAEALLDQASVAALNDAKARAARLAESQGKRLGAIYSISEFQTRRSEQSALYPTRRIEGQANAIALQGLAAKSSERFEPFEPGTMTATATVYVVFLLK